MLQFCVLSNAIGAVEIVALKWKLNGLKILDCDRCVLRHMGPGSLQNILKFHLLVFFMFKVSILIYKSKDNLLKFVNILLFSHCNVQKE